MEPTRRASSATRLEPELGTPGDRGHDAELVVRGEGGLQPSRGANVVVIAVDVDEVTQPPGRFEDPRLKAGIAALQVLERLGHGGSLDLRLGGPPGQLAQRAGHPDLDTHR